MTRSKRARISAVTTTWTATAYPTALILATHPTHGAYFTRGTTKDRYARYSETGPDYIENVTRLLRKFETAKKAGAGARVVFVGETRAFRRDFLRLAPARRCRKRWRYSPNTAYT
jgi:hypothetical protein